jgi:hypothetical protein
MARFVTTLIDSILMPLEACDERAGLSQAVVDAVSKGYRAREEYEAAKQKRSANTDPLAAALQRARESERVAVRALDDHTKKHSCKA